MPDQLPPALRTAIEGVLSASGDQTPLQGATRVGGGDINEAARIHTMLGTYFVKWQNGAPQRFFESEAAGLRLLGEYAPTPLRIPQVIGHGSAGRVDFLVLGWIDRGPGRGHEAAEVLGRSLAGLHQTHQPAYGLDHDNFIGRLPQPNSRSDSWIAFYRDRRLGAQRDLAARNGLLPPSRAERLDRVMASLEKWIDEEHCQPSLLHGDLWGGNWMVDAQGQPVLIDPAVYYGGREADLAMTALFGGFPEAFYAAYREAYPLAPGYAERQLLYQLYYLLCHLNLFGEGYGSSVDSILRRYAG